MKIGIVKEILPGETRVAVVPQMVAPLLKDGHEVLFERGAGALAMFPDEEYEKAGATPVEKASEVYEKADVILKVQPPMEEGAAPLEIDLLKPDSILIGFLRPAERKDLIKQLAEKKITSLALEFVPRISRAQSMDALSSMASLGGYKAVIIAADRLGKILPMMTTAAGTIPPATVLVLGAGVAGLQAIATAKRLGARVEAFDPRPVVKEQVQSLGATFVEMPTVENVETAGGYAKEQSEEFLRQEQQVIGERLPKTDVVVTTAAIFGKRAPLLITEEMVRIMRGGSVIIDLAAEQGGNCALTKPGEFVEKDGVTIYGPVNLPATIPRASSRMYSKNITTLFLHVFGKGKQQPDFEDEIAAGACITHQGEIRNEMIRNLVADQPKEGDRA